MLKLNLFSVLESLDSITKKIIKKAASRLGGKMSASPENYVKLRVAAQIMNELASNMADELDIGEGIEYKGVKLSLRSNRSKDYDDKELEDLTAILSELNEKRGEVDAKISARKLYLDKVGKVRITEHSKSIVMRVP